MSVKAKLNYTWRFFATGFGFSLFGLGGLFISQILFRLEKLKSLSPDERQRRAKITVQKAFRFFMNYMDRVGVVAHEYHGLEKVKDDSGCIVLANHPSLVDAVAVMAVYPKANCIVKDGLWQNPFLRDIVAGTGYINSSQGDDVIRMAGTSLDKGENLVIFPEGTRSVPNQPMKLKRGAAHVALRLNRPIRIVHIQMNPTTLTKSEKWYNIPPQRAKIKVSIGEKILPEAFPSDQLPPSIRARHLNRMIQEKLENTPF